MVKKLGVLLLWFLRKKQNKQTNIKNNNKIKKKKLVNLLKLQYFNFNSMQYMYLKKKTCLTIKLHWNYNGCQTISTTILISFAGTDVSARDHWKVIKVVKMGGGLIRYLEKGSNSSPLG